MAVPRLQPVTRRQLSIMIDYMETNPKFFIGKLSKTFTVDHKRAMWSELTYILNESDPGCQKTTDKWIRTWCDWKSSVKKRGISIRKAKKRMVDCQKMLTDLEERCFALIASTTLLNDSDSDTSSKDVGDSDTCSKDEGQIKIEVDVEDEEVITSDITPPELTSDITSPEIKDTTVDGVTQLRITAVKSIDTVARDVRKADTTVAGIVGNAATVGVQKFIPGVISSTRMERLRDIVAVKTEEPQKTLENASENQNITTTSNETPTFVSEKRPFFIKVESMDSGENLGTKIKIEVEEEEVITPELISDITSPEIKDTTIDDATQLRITATESLDTDARDVGKADTTAVGIAGNATARVQKVIPVVSSTRVERLRNMAAVTPEEPQKALGNASGNQNITSTSNETLAFVSEKRPFFIRVEDMDSGESFGTTETGPEKRSLDELEEVSQPPPRKKQKKDSENLLGALPLNLQNSIMERLDTLNRNIETNTCALSILSKSISDSSEANVRAINHLARVINNIGNLLYSSLEKISKTQEE